MLQHWIRYIQPVSKSNHAMSLGVTCYFIHSVQLQSVFNTRARQPTSSNAFSWKETFQFQTKFQYSSVYHWTQLSIGSGNSMAPYMRKATLWNNVDQDVRRYVTSLGHTASNNEMEFGWHLIKNSPVPISYYSARQTFNEPRLPWLPPAMYHLISSMCTCDYVNLYFVTFDCTLLKNTLTLSCNKNGTHVHPQLYPNQKSISDCVPNN